MSDNIDCGEEEFESQEQDTSTWKTDAEDLNIDTENNDEEECGNEVSEAWRTEDDK